MGERRRDRKDDDGTADKEARRALRREELLDAASEAIRRDGPAISMEAMAAAAGVTKPILYRHFGDRDGLVLALAGRFSTNLMAELQRSLATAAEPRDLLASTIDTFVAFIEADPELYRFLVHRAAREEPGAADELQGFIRQVSQQVTLVLGEQMRLAGHDSGGAEPIAHGIVGMVHAAGDWWVDRRTMPRSRLVEYLTTVLWDGMVSLRLPAMPAEPVTAEETSR
ncbi:MAG TPA: TetR/AcrR family transcriptional regulator [Acidimicrobiales bacterium]|nr:TetR/AcrR family transcriptional regulator [Acidimicrobiales bacterium]